MASITPRPAALSFRILPVEEWPKLVEAGIEPFATNGIPTTKLDHWCFLVAEQEGRILGVSSLRQEVLNDWAMAPGQRATPAVIQGLWDATEMVLNVHGVKILHATVGDPDVQDQVERLGYVEAPGKLYMLYVPDCLLSRVN